MHKSTYYRIKMSIFIEVLFLQCLDNETTVIIASYDAGYFRTLSVVVDEFGQTRILLLSQKYFQKKKNFAHLITLV